MLDRLEGGPPPLGEPEEVLHRSAPRGADKGNQAVGREFADVIGDATPSTVGLAAVIRPLREARAPVRRAGLLRQPEVSVITATP